MKSIKINAKSFEAKATKYVEARATKYFEARALKALEGVEKKAQKAKKLLERVEKNAQKLINLLEKAEGLTQDAKNFLDDTEKFIQGNKKIIEKIGGKALKAEKFLEGAEGLTKKGKDFLEGAEGVTKKGKDFLGGVKINTQKGKDFLETVSGDIKDFGIQYSAKEKIIPMINNFAEQRKDGSAITKKEVEELYKTIMDQMVKDGIITQKQLNLYTAPILEKTPNGEKKLGPSQFQKDIAVIFNAQGQDIKSTRDKLLYGTLKICNSFNLKTLANICHKATSKESQQKITKIGTKVERKHGLTKNMVEEAKLLGEKVLEANKNKKPEKPKQPATIKRRNTLSK